MKIKTNSIIAFVNPESQGAANRLTKRRETTFTLMMYARTRRAGPIPRHKI
jgi:hypothetical protein